MGPLILPFALALMQCELTNQGEYLNPTAPGCGDVIVTYTQHATGDPDAVPLGYPVPVPVDSLTPVDGFRTYASLLAAQQDLLASSDVVTGAVVGNTMAGRDIWAYRVGRAGATTVYGRPKAAVMAVGGTHAREWQTPEILAGTFERLVAGADDGGVVQYLVDNVSVVLVPVLNVDGFLQTQAFPATTTADPASPRDGRMRRKNLRHASGGVVDGDLATVEDNTHGVDLNRNHPQGFRAVPQNADPRSLIHAGASAHSEPEVQAMLAAADLGPASRLRLFMDVHSFGMVYFAPQTGSAARDTATQALASAMRAVTGNKYAYSPDPVSAHIGTAADHFAVAYGVPAWTLEVEPRNGGQDFPGGTGASHSGFIMPDSEIARLRDEMADTFVLGFYHQAGPPSVVAAEIRDADGELVWAVDWTATGAATRTLTERASAALQPGAAYTAWIAFDKPMRVRAASGSVAQYRGQSARLAPGITLEVADGATVREVPLTGGEWLADDGYLNYEDDAYRVSFTLPDDLPTTATQAVLVVDADDLAGRRLDGDPSTAADWQAGWTGYQDQQPDCSYRLWIGAVGTTHDLECKALDDTPTPPAPPSGGGGGHGGWLLLLLPLLLVSRRR